MIAMPKKVTTAIIERTDRRATPHTPWPEVQPLPIFVPRPTSNPAIAIQSGLPTNSAVAPPGPPTPRPGTAIAVRKPPVTIVIRNMIRQSTVCAGGSNCPNMPDIPAIRPLPIHNRADASPINAPPINAVTGENASIQLNPYTTGHPKNQGGRACSLSQFSDGTQTDAGSLRSAVFVQWKRVRCA